MMIDYRIVLGILNNYRREYLLQPDQCDYKSLMSFISMPGNARYYHKKLSKLNTLQYLERLHLLFFSGLLNDN